MTGLTMPKLGYGTYGRRGEAGVRAIRMALEAGFRHLDTAQDYGTEGEVGRAVRENGVARHEVFVTTKIGNGNLHRVVASLEDSRRELGLGQIDLALIHWPAPEGGLELEVYLTALAEAQAAGICRLIGVSNFPIALIEASERILGAGALSCNQIELNPLFKNAKVAGDCLRRGIAITCYRPVAHGGLGAEPVLGGIAAAHGVTREQVALAWEWAKGYAAIPTSTKAERIGAAFDAQKIVLTAAEIARIDAIPDGPRGIGRSGGPAWD